MNWIEEKWLGRGEWGWWRTPYAFKQAYRWHWNTHFLCALIYSAVKAQVVTFYDDKWVRWYKLIITTSAIQNAGGQNTVIYSWRSGWWYGENQALVLVEGERLRWIFFLFFCLPNTRERERIAFPTTEIQSYSFVLIRFDFENRSSVCGPHENTVS